MKPLTSTTAAEIATAIPGILRDRADREDSREWENADSFRYYVMLLRSVAAWRADDKTVLAMVINPAYADVWGHVVAEAIDTASDGYDLPRGHIRMVAPGQYVFSLVCECGGACTLPAQ